MQCPGSEIWIPRYMKLSIVPLLLPPNVHDHLFGDVQDQVAPLTPGQILHFLQAGLFIVFCDQAGHSYVISKLDDGA